MKFIVLILFSFLAYAQDIKPLNLNRIYKGSSSLEISGFVKTQGRLFAVSDNSEDTWLYSVDLKGTYAIYNRSIDIKALDGYWSYYLKTLLSNNGGRWLKAPWDLEGASVCADKIYIINEQAREVLVIEGDKLSKLDVDLEKAFEEYGAPFHKSPANAGFEGIAIDCENQNLYLAQERSPRAIALVNLRTLKVEKISSTEILADNINPDYADLFFDKSYLYVLERNTRRVLKLNPQSLELIQSVSYAQLDSQIQTSELYETGEVYGLGEALFMSDRHIFIGLDNNKNSFSKKAKVLFSVEGNNSAILKFNRPAGF